MKTTKTFFLLSLFLVASLSGFALDYTITFTGSGASTTVGDVLVQNLTKGTSVTVPSGNTLNLTVETAVEQPSATDETIHVYSNSVEGKSTVSFFAKQTGVTQINAFGIDGRKIAGTTANLQAGMNSFQVSLPKGAYAIQVSGNGYTYSAKMINQSTSPSKPEITYIGTVKPASSNPQKSKSSALGTTTMTYAAGDQLLYKGTSENYSTIVTDVPTESKTTNFGFVDCTDADGNYYTVVTIGTQTWMAENLKTTKYNDGTSISNVTDKYYWYNNDDATYKNTYGALYNWYAAVNTAQLAPTGWHVPTDAEWTTLTTYLGDNSGAKLKETGTAHWTSLNVATNETGFSALPGGCYSGGTFKDVGGNGYWLSTTEHSADASYEFIRYMNYNQIPNIVSVGGVLKADDGVSVRCVMDPIVAIPTEPESNSYIVARNSSISIPVSRAYAANSANFSGSTMPWTTGLLWTDVANPLTESGTIASIEGANTSSVTGSITITTGSATGNAVVYVKNSAGNICWSWHIWVTDYDPSANTISYNGLTWMDRNLGATNNTPGDIGCMGLFCQWGRKDPFPGPTTVNGTTEKTLYGEDGEATSIATASVAASPNLVNAIQNPATFYMAIGADGDWYESDGTLNDALWGSAKTIYDPSPVGWKVPAEGAWDGLSGTYSAPGITFTTIGWFQACGLRSFNSGRFDCVGSIGYYWSSTAQSYGGSGMAFTDSGYVGTNNGGPRAYGRSVRCVKE